jgi:CheY-like chemotaxis protein
VSRAELNPEPLRVLVVDDTPDLRDLITMALERTGEFVVVAHA